MMKRSSPLAVHVDIRINGNINSSSADGLHPLAASELLFATSRIRTLRLSGLRGDILHVLNRLRSPSSQLESLSLSIYDGGGPSVLLPVSLFGGNDKAVPNLRCLTFATDTCISAPLWLLGVITEFTTGADMALPELLETLRAMPQLEILRVQHCRAVWDEDAAATEGPALRTVTLPHLRLISFRDTTPRRFVLLIPRIDAPPTVRRHLFWRLWAVASWERWSGMLDAMRAFIPRDSVFGARDSGLRASRVRGGPARGSFHSSPFFHLGGLCSQLPAMRVSDLMIEPEPEPEPEPKPEQAVMSGHDAASMVHWESLLRALESVQSLRLHGSEGDRLGKGILSSLRAVVSDSDSDTLLPHLQKLYIVQCDVRCATQLPQDGVVLRNLKRFALPSGGHAGPVARDGGVGCGVGNEMVALVQRRVGLEVILVGCGVDDEALDKLGKYVQADKRLF